ncbi:MAG: SUMF1/EgtB/PvdO family nonheme iron enzyme, partial [Candidatus Marinimicrobia bacterium]|nr:SUMF1/EgtB/PvdO family nonheme iron enzyme [Candidatus Neomarinimicrobiota bacterium]
RTGRWNGWFKNGQKKSEGTYRNGNLIGKYETWFENGKKEWEHYNNDDGTRDSTKLTIRWYENGQKQFEGYWKNTDDTAGVWIGKHTVWYENGQKSWERTFKDGKEDGLMTYWYQNGQKEWEATFKDGKEDGLVTRWYEDGREIIPIIPEFVAVEGGTFQMGSNIVSDEKPVHSVTVSDFNISKTEVTFEQYDAFCDATGRDKPDDEGWGRGNRPVIYVDWQDAFDYCEWMSKTTGKTYRLPTEAEWEYAARGGSKSKGYTYSGGNNLYAVAWYDNNSRDKTHPVAQKQPNELGLYDMSGNVYEWCSDWYGDYSSSPQTDPQGSNSEEYRVLRGGGWLHHDSGCRVAFRLGYSPDGRYNFYGFRLVLSPDLSA